VQNRIQNIEGLEALKALRNLELGANKIRVCGMWISSIGLGFANDRIGEF
jgi:hypothetical protein